MTAFAYKIITLINGRPVKRREAKISVFDNALLYAEGLFEAFLAVDERVILLEEHLQRLYRGSRLLGLRIPVTEELLTTWLYKAARIHPERIKKIRLTVTSGESPKWVGKQGKQQVIITASSHQMPNRPFRLYVSDYRLDQKSQFRRIKTLSYITHAVSLKQAHSRKCDDALLLNEDGYIAEITSANIFWVSKGKIYTPPLTSGCLEGVTRSIAINEALKAGYRVFEKNKRLPDLLHADEIFLSSSLKLILGISHILYQNEKYIFKIGPVTRYLAKRLKERLQV